MTCCTLVIFVDGLWFGLLCDVDHNVTNLVWGAGVMIFVLSSCVMLVYLFICCDIVLSCY